MIGGDDLGAALIHFRERIRCGFAAACAPFVDWLARCGVDPDHVTWTGFALAALAALVAGFGWFVAAGVLYIVGGAADLLDGALARRRGGGSRRGAFLDSTLDRAGEGLLHVGAAVAFARIGLWVGVVAVMLSLTGAYLTSYARVRAESLGIELEEAWVGRGERIILLAAGLVFHFALIAFWILAAAGWGTATQRTTLAWRRLADEREGPAGDAAAKAPSQPADGDLPHG